jgi:hypothetical protein
MITETIEIQGREPLFPLGGVTFSGPTVAIMEKLFTRPIVPIRLWRNQHPRKAKVKPGNFTHVSIARDHIRVR